MFKGLSAFGLAAVLVGAVLLPQHEQPHLSVPKNFDGCNEKHMSPELAQKFVRWWTQAGLINQSHEGASGWMIGNTEASFNRIFWSHRNCGNIECRTTQVWTPVVKDDSTVEIGVSCIWINKSNPSVEFKMNKITFVVIREQLGLRIAKFTIEGDPEGSATSKSLNDIETNSRINLSTQKL